MPAIPFVRAGDSTSSRVEEMTVSAHHGLSTVWRLPDRTGPPMMSLNGGPGRDQGEVLRNDFELSQHAVDQAILRHISMNELRDAVATSEVLEDYPTDKYGPSCLVLGFTTSGRPMHVQVSYPSRPIIKVITVYEPEPERWIDHRQRRPL